jgi:hypothetical protein
LEVEIESLKTRVPKRKAAVDPNLRFPEIEDNVFHHLVGHFSPPPRVFHFNTTWHHHIAQKPFKKRVELL